MERLRLHMAPSPGQSSRSGMVVFGITLVLLSLVAGANLVGQNSIFVAGEIAAHEVTADRDLLVEDQQATAARREQVSMLQPAVFDLSVTPVADLHQRVLDLFRTLNNADIGDLETLRLQLSEQLSMDLSARTLNQWSSEEVQTYATTRVLPWIEQRLTEGVSSDMRLLLQFKGGILVRDLTTGAETLRSNLHAIPDIRSLLSDLTQTIKNDNHVSLQSRRAVVTLITPLLQPTLTLNREATQARATDVAQAVEPVYYRLQKGEVVVRQGDPVSREQQLKLQSLYAHKGGRVQLLTVLGACIMAGLLSTGLFVTPSGRPGRPLTTKDLLFIALLLIVFTVLAKGMHLLASRVVDGSFMQALAYSFPVAGAAGLSALIFSARRYCTTGLLLAFFATLCVRGDLPLFLFYFTGAMLNTWLVTRSQNRQDVVWNLFPLLLGQLAVWLGAALLDGTLGNLMLVGLSAIIINSVLSLLLLFALSPILELAFGYTTRFRLMELMNLEQPLLQDLMVAVPGTYHHSLIVSNMVEAAAKAIGANSLLCKVAALYHDIGKLARPEYFIENQFGARNKHDKLAPSMSSLILQSHVKHGVELAENHKLGQEIVDIIRQHHGTRVIRFFFQKAVNLGENPREEDYRYAGPRPQSREAAIVMLADAVEASSRTLVDPTPARVRGHIDSMVKGIFAEGQLDESELTFKDLHKLSESFHRILTGLFHQRIEYPESAKDKERKAQAKADKPADNADEATPQPTAATATPAAGGNGNGASANTTAPTTAPCGTACEDAAPAPVNTITCEPGTTCLCEGPADVAGPCTPLPGAAQPPRKG